MTTQDGIIATHFDYDFSSLGESFGSAKPYLYNPNISKLPKFNFQLKTVKPCYDIMQELNIQNTLESFFVPAWAKLINNQIMYHI